MTGSCYVILTLSHYIGASVIGECLSRTRYLPFSFSSILKLRGVWRSPCCLSVFRARRVRDGSIPCLTSNRSSFPIVSTSSTQVSDAAHTGGYPLALYRNT
ncbi:hypothetical protein F5Y04DRAFT_177842 [Hypomontagnella monticulosa]|nr:hypothetical protein F5Y04DRAFT_177842 [Hypomontagnella monticulosa]